MHQNKQRLLYLLPPSFFHPFHSFHPISFVPLSSSSSFLICLLLHFPPPSLSLSLSRIVYPSVVPLLIFLTLFLSLYASVHHLTARRLDDSPLDVAGEFFVGFGFTFGVFDLSGGGRTVIHLHTYDLPSAEGPNSFTFNQKYFLPEYKYDFDTVGVTSSNFFNTSLPACEMHIEFLNTTKGNGCRYYLSM